MPRAGPILALIACGAVWGLTLPLLRIAVSTGYPPFGLILWHKLIMAAVLAPLLQSSKVVGIAVMDRDRVPGMALPTIAEAGLPDYLKYDWSSWFIVFAPKAVPAPVLERLNAEIAVALKDEELIKRYREFGLTPTPRTVAASNTHLEQDVKAWPPVFKSLGLAQ